MVYSVTDGRDTPAVLSEDGTGTVSEVTGMQINDNVVESSVSSGEEGDNVSTHSGDLREEYTGEDSEDDISLSAGKILLSSSLVDSGDTDADLDQAVEKSTTYKGQKWEQKKEFPPNSTDHNLNNQSAVPQSYSHIFPEILHS